MSETIGFTTIRCSQPCPGPRLRLLVPRLHTGRSLPVQGDDIVAMLTDTESEGRSNVRLVSLNTNAASASLAVSRSRPLEQTLHDKV
ncbi:hypothetical protein BaRGS_00002141 [Batillaria attramentaria]|uniref:Uncharacterized protein n=1 Tax=Batillaria attramentaria TaxID=370345 RepID=A0ABD0M4E2_9CAEN